MIQVTLHDVGLAAKFSVVGYGLGTTLMGISEGMGAFKEIANGNYLKGTGQAINLFGQYRIGNSGFFNMNDWRDVVTYEWGAFLTGGVGDRVPEKIE